MNKLNVAFILRTDARVRPSDAGGEFAKYLIKENLLNESLECDCRDVHPAVLISAFFVNFCEELHQANPDSLKMALGNIKWVMAYDWQSNNIERWMAPYKDKLLSETPIPLIDLRSFADRIKNHQDEGESLMRELRMCPLWKAIQNSIENATKNECGLMEKVGSLVHHRGTGAFSLTKVYAFPAGADDPYNSVRFCFDVSCWDDERDCEVDANVMLDFPLVFLSEFDQALFDEWVEDKQKEQKAKNLEKARTRLDGLLKKYPELKEELNSKENEEN